MNMMLTIKHAIVANRIQCGIVTGLIILACVAVSQYPSLSGSPITEASSSEISDMTGITSPSGTPHPGQILFEDQIEQRQWTKSADEVPETMAWVDVEGIWYAVTRIEITGTVEQRRMTKYGQDGEFLETTIQAPPPRPSTPVEPIPEPIPEPKPYQN